MNDILQKSHVTSFRIFAEDTDYMRIVYHANYLRFFERARTEFLRTLNISLSELAQMEIHFAIHQAHLKYCLPARLDDIVTITTNAKACGKTSLKFIQVMHNQKSEKLCEAEVYVVCLNEQLKPRKLPLDFFGNSLYRTKLV